jgi:hypothetical protein
MLDPFEASSSWISRSPLAREMLDFIFHYPV